MLDEFHTAPHNFRWKRRYRLVSFMVSLAILVIQREKLPIGTLSKHFQPIWLFTYWEVVKHTT